MPAAVQTALSARQEARTMPRRNRRAPMAPLSDLGPSIRHQRGELVTEFRADPDNPQRGTVKGAKVRVWYHVAWIEGLLTDEQHEAADRYDVWANEATRLSEGRPSERGVGAGRFSGPGERLVWLRAQLREADEVLGPDARLIRQVVGFNCTPAMGEVALVRAALQRLADYWGM